MITRHLIECNTIGESHNYCNTDKDRWKNSTRDQKYALGTNSSNRVNGKISSFKKCGVRQGCVLSTDLLPLYSEMIMRNLEGYPGIRLESSM